MSKSQLKRLRIQAPRRPGFAFDCFKKGHTPMEGVPEEIMIIGKPGYPHMGRICAKCKGAYFEQLSNVPMAKSGVVDISGKEIIV